MIMLSSSAATAAGHHAVKRTTTTVPLRRLRLLPSCLRSTSCLGATGDLFPPSSIDHRNRGDRSRSRSRSPLPPRLDESQTAPFRSFSRTASTRCVARDDDHGGSNLRWHLRHPATLVGNGISIGIGGNSAGVLRSTDTPLGIIGLHTRPHRCRSSFSTVANASTASKEADEGGDQKKKEEEGGKKKKEEDDDGGSNIFFDNIGKIFLGSIALVIASLVRSSKSQGNKERMRELLETEAILDPLEIDDLRCANAPDLNGETFRRIMTATIEAFPDGRATYGDFVSAALHEMKEMRGEGFTVQLGHLLDRAAIAVLEERQRPGGSGDVAVDGDASGAAAVAPDGFSSGSGLDGGGGTYSEDGSLLPLPLLHAILSMALSGPVDERVALLFSSMRGTEKGGAGDDPQTASQEGIGAGASSADDGTVSEDDVVAMVGYLQSTGQLPPATQILEEAGAKYPTQKYKRGLPRELVDKAKEQLGMIDKEGRDVAGKSRRYRLEDFDNVLRCNSVCAWGECYSPRKSK